jgi:glycosyl transferase family 11
MKTVIVRLNGGLGNQLFEYAAARMLAHKHNATLRIDASGFKKDNYYGRACQLQHFNIRGKIFEGGIWKKIITPGNRWYASMKRLNMIQWKEEQGFYIHSDFFEIKKMIAVLNGYWQSPDYFNDIRELLLKELTLCRPVKKIKEIIGSNETLASVHVRMHLSNDTRYGRLTLEYYQHAMHALSEKAGHLSFVIFSDDVQWCKENIKHPLNGKLYFMDDYGIEKDYEQLILMSQCDHHIIANSTFSWWGAWLCNNEKKIVIRPERPFNDGTLLYEHYFPGNWLMYNN